MLLGMQDTPGAAIKASEVLPMSSIRHPIRPVLDVIAAARMLADDRVAPIVRWFDLQISTLPDQMRQELRVWFDIARNGSVTPPRFRPRAEATVKSQLAFALPTLRAWAREHPSLREIGRDDVLSALPPSGAPRSTTLQGLRSIFRVLKARKLTFINPTARISVPKPNASIPAPATCPRCVRPSTTAPTPPGPRWRRCWPSTPSGPGNCAVCASPICTMVGCTCPITSSRSPNRSGSG
jgi:hypothetical protein